MYDIKLVWEAKKEMNFPFYAGDKVSFTENKEELKDNLIEEQKKETIVSKVTKTKENIEAKAIQEVKKLRDKDVDLYLDTSKNISYVLNMIFFLISKNITIGKYDPNALYLDTDVILLCADDDFVKNAKTFVISEDLNRKKELFAFLKDNFKERIN